MSGIYRSAIICTCIVVAGGIIGLVTWRCTKAPIHFASELSSADADYSEVMCGPVSLSIALGRLGISRDHADLASKCRVTFSGVSLTDLERVVVTLPSVNVSVRKLTWEELRLIDGAAVLFVNGNHYVAADPREKRAMPGNATAVRVYDGKRPARWFSSKELEDIWDGESLVVTKALTPRRVTDEACIVWDECYTDLGVLENAKNAHYGFVCRNVGGRELLIQDMRTTCGCVKPALSTTRIQPRKTGKVDVDVALDSREGSIQQSLFIKTNDPSNPLSFLTMACAVPRKSPLSIQTIRLGDLPQGGNVHREIVVADQRFGGMSIRDARFILGGTTRQSDALSCSLTWEMIGDNASALRKRTGFSAFPGDFALRLSFDADRKCPLGPFEGRVLITVGASGSVTTHEIEIQGLIVQDAYSVPQMALVVLGPDPLSVGTATIELRSRANQPIRVVKTQLDGFDSLQVTPDEAGDAGTRYVITSSASSLAAGDTPYTGTIRMELQSGAVVAVPVTVFRPPQGSQNVSEQTFQVPPKKLSTSR